MMSVNIHTKGLICVSCCCGAPLKCDETKNCIGLLHQYVVEDDPEDGWIHNIRCDVCDYHYTYLDSKKIEFNK